MQLEAQVANLEERKADLGARIGCASEARNMDRLAELMSALQQVEADLEQGMAQWEEIGQQLEGY